MTDLLGHAALAKVVEARGGVPNFEYLCLLDKCQHIIRDARGELGQDLGGWGVHDLLCDNTEESTDVVDLVLKDLGES